ncbi:MAG: NAD(P)H-dependent flavin oxidoreductase [Pelagimonas sp.]|uniref:NAD(P)H-dependent flavin oxidoreductase n=1 Tax=Pelagimonas sp. TaxID=2073170 RepID=UPI003D6C0D84
MKTRLTDLLGLAHPVIQAPMALAAGGALAQAVTQAGGLGMIGGGYCNSDWIMEQFDLADGARVGCGFITWALAENPSVLEAVLDRDPAALFLSFGDPEPFSGSIKRAGVPLMCQVQTLRDAKRALASGADVIVAQGSEAGGHGQARGTMSLVPEIADEISRSGHSALLCAAGGISDGRGLAAARMLGADGVVIGTRFWATQEALVQPRLMERALASSGDETLRTSVIDIIRKMDWPSRYSCRVLNNELTARWHGDEADLAQHVEDVSQAWSNAMAQGDPNIATPIVGEAIGLITDKPPAAEVLHQIMSQAHRLMPL